MEGQMTLFAMTRDDDDTERLIRDMWRCIQVSPCSPPALKESIRQRLVERGTEV